MYTVCEIVIVFALWIWQKMCEKRWQTNSPNGRKLKEEREKSIIIFAWLTEMPFFSVITASISFSSIYFNIHTTKCVFQLVDAPVIAMSLHSGCFISVSVLFNDFISFIKTNFATHFTTNIFHYKGTSF